mgnify:CR=1 FL=1
MKPKYKRSLINRVRKVGRLLQSDSSGITSTSYLWSLKLTPKEEDYIWSLAEELAYPTSEWELGRRVPEKLTEAVRFREWIESTKLLPKKRCSFRKRPFSLGV